MRRKGRGDATLKVPGYTDLEEIGGGAYATVFRAVETETGRPVALKVMKFDTVHADLLETFNREIQALAAISGHPNIVTLYRPCETPDGRPVLVLELCRESLGKQLRDAGPRAAVEVTRTGVKIAGALETAHRNGFLHRDMKPQNLLITYFGEPALADFGVAALQASAQSTAGLFGLTTLHAAPEMLEGHHLSPATDVYGLASTMYQLIAGRAPFEPFDHEAPASVILRILCDPVPPLRADDVPLRLADLLETALAKEPEGRPRSAADFARALQEVEAKEGWAVTSFTAWGEDGPRSEAASGPVDGEKANAGDRGPMGVRTGRTGAPPLAPSSPAGSQGPRAGSRLPPLLPPSSRPSVVPPAQGSRNVVDPRGVRGRFGSPTMPEPNPPLLAHRGERDGDGSSASARPEFADPHPVETRSEPRAVDSFARRPDDRRPAGAVLPGWATGALVLAAVVVVAAVLLLLGVF